MNIRRGKEPKLKREREKALGRRKNKAKRTIRTIGNRRPALRHSGGSRADLAAMLQSMQPTYIPAFRRTGAIAIIYIYIEHDNTEL